MLEYGRTENREADALGKSELDIQIVDLQTADDVSAFKSLNEEWISRHFILEAKDREILGNPEKYILSKGGRVFMVYHKKKAVGCVALVPMGNDIYELSKMAVAPELRGFGLGRRLLNHAIVEARSMRAACLFLVSNTKLKDAVHLYESVGFQHVPQERAPKVEYVRANVFMDLQLRP